MGCGVRQCSSAFIFLTTEGKRCQFGKRRKFCWILLFLWCVFILFSHVTLPKILFNFVPFAVCFIRVFTRCGEQNFVRFCWILLFLRSVLFVFLDVAVHKILLHFVVLAFIFLRAFACERGQNFVDLLHGGQNFVDLLQNFVDLLHEGAARKSTRGGTSGSNRGPASRTTGSTQAHEGRNRWFQQRPRIKDHGAAC